MTPTIRDRVIAEFKSRGFDRIDPWAVSAAIRIVQQRPYTAPPKGRDDLVTLAREIGEAVAACPCDRIIAKCDLMLEMLGEDQ